MEKISCVYRITNIQNGKIYVGKTINLKRRIKEYRNNVNGKLKDSAKYEIIQVMREHGFNNFKFDILEECPESELDEREIYYIKKLDSRNPLVGYNKKTGGKGGTMPPDTHLKMSRSSIGFKHSEEHKLSMSKPIIAYKDNRFKIWQSAKVFGDVLGVGKSVVTHAIKSGYQIKGYFVYYYDKNERNNNLPTTTNCEYYKILKFFENEDVETIENNYTIIV